MDFPNEDVLVNGIKIYFSSGKRMSMLFGQFAARCAFHISHLGIFYERISLGYEYDLGLVRPLALILQLQQW